MYSHVACDVMKERTLYLLKPSSLIWHLMPYLFLLDLHLSISNDIVSTKIYDKRDDFDFEMVNFPFLDGDVPRSTSYGVYISQLIRFARASSYVADFNTCNKLLTQKLLKQGYRYHKLRKTFSKFYCSMADAFFFDLC